MAVAGIVINLLLAFQNRRVLAVVTLSWRHEFQATVLVLLVVPAHEFLRPCLRLLQASKRFSRVVRPVFAGAE